MLPELFRIPFLNLPVHTYGTLHIVAMLVFVFVAYRQALLRGKYVKHFTDIGFYLLLGALIGARILFIIVKWKYHFVEEPFTHIPKLGISIPTVLAFWKGGFVFLGGILGGIIAGILFCKKRNLPVLEIADICALGGAIAHAISRIACVAAGCCFGHASYHLDGLGSVIADTPFAQAYPPGTVAYRTFFSQGSEGVRELMVKLGTTVPLFPVQIVESIGGLIIFFVLMFITPMKRAHGQIFCLFLILYSIMRLFTETFRGDSGRGFVFDNMLSTSQFISLLILTAALVMMFVLSYKQNKQLKELHGLNINNIIKPEISA